MKTKPTNEFDNFLDALVAELIATPDEQVLEGLDPAAVQAASLQRLKAAKAEAGRRRMAAAKAGVAASQGKEATRVEPEVSAEEARRSIAQAANDRRYTLAARSVTDLSDEEALRLYRQMKALEAGGTPDGASE
jgi:hypothetical protein